MFVEEAARYVRGGPPSQDNCCRRPCAYYELSSPHAVCAVAIPEASAYVLED